MAGSGLVKGFADGTDPGAVPEGFNSLRIRVSFQEYQATPREQRPGFPARFKALLEQAGARGMTVLPVLLTDEDLSAPPSELGEYVKDMVGSYYDDQTILAWDLYFHPGEKADSREKVEQVIDTVFAYARNQYPNQPVFMTPCVSVKPFKPDFDFRGALIHGRRRGWDMLQYKGVSDPDLVYKVWSLSDVTAFSSRQPSAETGWLLSICYRFGRPVFCSRFEGEGQEQEKILDLFAKSHVYWFSSEDVPEEIIRNFKFIPIQTKH